MCSLRSEVVVNNGLINMENSWNSLSFHDVLNDKRISKLKSFHSCAFGYFILLEKVKKYIGFSSNKDSESVEITYKISDLSEALKMTKKTVIFILKSLSECGLIQVKKQGGSKPNIIVVNNIKSEPKEIIKEVYVEEETNPLIHIEQEQKKECQKNNTVVNGIKGVFNKIFKKNEFEPELDELSPEIKEIFEHYKKELGRPESKLDRDRYLCIRRALSDLSFDKDSIKKAISGTKESPFHMGINDQSVSYCSLRTILKNADSIEGLINIYEKKDEKYIPVPSALNIAKELIGEVHEERYELEYEHVPEKPLEPKLVHKKIFTTKIGFKKPDESSPILKIIHSVVSSNFSVEEIKNPTKDVTIRFASLYKKAVADLFK